MAFFPSFLFPGPWSRVCWTGGGPLCHVRETGQEGRPNTSVGPQGLDKPQKGAEWGRSDWGPGEAESRPRSPNQGWVWPLWSYCPAPVVSRVLFMSQPRGTCSPVLQRAWRLTVGTCQPNGASAPRGQWGSERGGKVSKVTQQEPQRPSILGPSHPIWAAAPPLGTLVLGDCACFTTHYSRGDPGCLTEPRLGARPSEAEPAQEGGPLGFQIPAHLLCDLGQVP